MKRLKFKWVEDVARAEDVKAEDARAKHVRVVDAKADRAKAEDASELIDVRGK